MIPITVTDYWFRDAPSEQLPADVGFLRVVVVPDLRHERRLTVLTPAGSGGFVILTPEMAETLAVAGGEVISASALEAKISSSGIALNGADIVFYFPAEEASEVSAEPVPEHVRQLTADDADVFATFVAEAPEGDLDEAFVELDHWLVYGAFDGDRLVCAASMYPFDSSPLADLGIITLPSSRGRGLARQTLRAMSAHAIRRAYEPQYRCQLDNHASIGLARSAGLTVFATWDVVEED